MFVCPGGVVVYIDNDQQDDMLRDIGIIHSLKKLRASHVEWDEAAQGWYIDMTPLDSKLGVLPMRFQLRDEALMYEKEIVLAYLRTNRLFH